MYMEEKINSFRETNKRIKAVYFNTKKMETFELDVIGYAIVKEWDDQVTLSNIYPMIWDKKEKRVKKVDELPFLLGITENQGIVDWDKQIIKCLTDEIIDFSEHKEQQYITYVNKLKNYLHSTFGIVDE